MKKFFPADPPLLYKACIAIMILLWSTDMDNFLSFPLTLSGIPLFISGTYLAIKAKRLFKITGTPIKPEADPIILHQKGAFRYSRNPMYLGIILGLFGLAILTGKTVNLLFPFLYFFIMDKYFIKNEEIKLQEKFGKDFTKYKQSTKRWI